MTHKPGSVISDWYGVINRDGHLSEVCPAMYFARGDIEPGEMPPMSA